MADDVRIEDLRRRLQKDPASIAFAQLAEELRRAGRHEEAVGACRTGLAVYPEYLSARVTLGRSLLELNRLDDAQRELEQVRRAAPENMAAIRALAEIHERLESTQQSAPHESAPIAGPEASGRESPRLVRTLAALEGWLAAVYVARAQRRA